VGAQAPAVANIGAGERRKRLWLGLVCSAAGVAAIVFDLAAASRVFLLAVFGLFLVGALGVLQARGHT
jgi:hypothetical protein